MIFRMKKKPETDPTDNLKKQLQIAEVLLRGHHIDFETDMRLAWELAELVETLHVWISKGGQLPDAWIKKHG